MVAPRPYVDSSALVRLVREEPESHALREFLITRRAPVTNRIATVEVRRALLRAGREPDFEALTAIWKRVELVEMDAAIAESAASLGPPTLRSLDAIHLNSALSLGDDLEAFVTYDARLAKAARGHGLPVVAPA